MSTKNPDQIVADSIAKALVEARLLDAAAQSKVMEKVAGGQITAAEWQSYLKPASQPTQKT